MLRQKPKISAENAYDSITPDTAPHGHMATGSVVAFIAK
jgi:hypothetical protein